MIFIWKNYELTIAACALIGLCWAAWYHWDLAAYAFILSILTIFLVGAGRGIKEQDKDRHEPM